ncbi:type IX secretion system membrane protein PorP/SprF [Urechidicola sp. KH5]
MNRTTFINLLVVFFLILNVTTWAQQDPQYTHYMYNMSVINPAYTLDDDEVLQLGVMHRNQWTGVNGAPVTNVFFAHGAVSDKIDLGVSITNDQIGKAVKENNIYADFAYSINVNKRTNLSFGLKTGVTLFDVDFANFQLEDPSDFGIAFQNRNETFFNMGAGLYLNNRNYYIGLSAPNMIRATHTTSSNGQYKGVEEVHWYATGGYVLQLNASFKLKPAVMMKAVKGAPLSVDFTLNALYNDRFEVGIAYRTEDALSALMSIGITNNLKFGYAYDYTLSNLGNYSSGSHEVFLLYDVFLGATKYKSPRYF